MNANMHSGGRRRSLWKGPALITAVILLIPLLGNYFVDGWNWPLRAFVLFGTIVFGPGLMYQLVARNMGTIAYRAAVGIGLVTAFVLVWGNFIQAADDVNRAAVARFRPSGMARASFAVALAQALVLAIVLSRNPPVTDWSAAVWRGFGG